MEKTPLIVDTKSLTEGIDLLSANDHLTHSELLRWIIGQVTCLWKQHFKVDLVEVKGAKETKETNKGERDKDKDKEKEKDKDALVEDNTWKPWGHIWPKDKNNGVHSQCWEYAVYKFLALAFGFKCHVLEIKVSKHEDVMSCLQNSKSGAQLEEILEIVQNWENDPGATVIIGPSFHNHETSEVLNLTTVSLKELLLRN